MQSRCNVRPELITPFNSCKSSSLIEKGRHSIRRFFFSDATARRAGEN